MFTIEISYTSQPTIGELNYDSMKYVESVYKNYSFKLPKGKLKMAHSILNNSLFSLDEVSIDIINHDLNDSVTTFDRVDVADQYITFLEGQGVV